MLNNLFRPKSPGSPPPPARGAKVDLDKRFLLGERNSDGSMSKVYRAVELATNRTVGLKIQIPEKSDAAAARAADGKPSEGEIASQIDHPHVVKTFDWGLTPSGEQFIVMEYVDGVSLEYVRQSIKLGLRGKMKILIQAAQGFAGIHKAGFIHHDINPRNVLINRSNVVKVIDFGLAVPDTAPFHKPGNRTGCLSYMAPELIRREATDARLDVFAFAAMAFEFLTDKLPFGGGSDSMAAITQRINAPPLDPAEANPRLSPETCALLLRSLAKRKEDRPTMAALAEGLADAPYRRGLTTDDSAD